LGEFDSIPSLLLPFSVLAVFSFPLGNCPISFSSSQLSLSLSLSLSHVQRGTLYWFGLDFHWEGGREEKHAATTDKF
jgi:hypothetical protein